MGKCRDVKTNLQQKGFTQQADVLDYFEISFVMVGPNHGWSLHTLTMDAQPLEATLGVYTKWKHFLNAIKII